MGRTTSVVHDRTVRGDIATALDALTICLLARKIAAARWGKSQDSADRAALYEAAENLSAARTTLDVLLIGTAP